MMVVENSMVRAVDYLTAKDVPEGRVGNVEVRRFEVSREAAALMALRYSFGGHPTEIREGTYTGLFRNKGIWMSDTPDEVRDHTSIVWSATWANAKRVLINGLGLGMVVNAMLRIPSVEEIDVVEIDPDVIALVGPHYRRLAQELGVRLEIHEADAYDIVWPRGTWWDIAWHDIWQDISTENLSGIAKLNRKYGKRVRAQGAWRKEYLQMMRERERRQGW